MPTLFRFLMILLVLAGVSYAGLWALANLVEPQKRDMTTSVPLAPRIAPSPSTP
jgi:hypothetical protein